MRNFLFQKQWNKLLHDHEKVCKQVSILLLTKKQLNWNQLMLIMYVSTDAIGKLKASGI